MRDIWMIMMFFATFGSSHATLSYSNVAISNSGYTGLVIAIHPDIAEDQELIQAIKETWTEASRDLYIATGNRAYFKNITILLPKTWTGYGYSLATGNEKYDLADVVVAPPDESYGNEPYTIQYGECGTMGIRTCYTPAYLLNDEFVQNYGPRGKVVVHEWAHYRWGVFDETSNEYPFYWEDSQYSANYGPSPTTCPNGISGEVLNVQAGYRECGLADIDVTTNSYPDYCVFFPDEVQNNINTSLLAYQYLTNVVTFCRDEDDAESDEHNVHNTEAPNDQNRLCSMKSVWSVIKESPDFLHWNVDALTDLTQTIPQFDVVIPHEYLRFVLVLDTSGSMASPCGSVTRLECLNTAAYQFITVTAPNNSYVGIVQFSSSARTLQPLTLLASQEDRERLAYWLTTLIADGGTCIGCGIQTAITELERGGAAAAGGELIVITDGEENVHPYVQEVAPEVMQKGVIVNTIFISTEANLDLKDLSEDSGGQDFFATNQQDLQEIFSQVSVSDSTDDNAFQIYSASFNVSAGSEFDSSLYIDSSIGLNTVFTFTWSIGNRSPHISIRSPSDCYYANYDTPDASICYGGNSSYRESTSFKTIQFYIPGVAEIGMWTYTVRSLTDVGLITCSVTSEPSNDTVESILMQSGMGQTQLSNGAATVYAKVTQGSNPVLGASVTATIEGPKGCDIYLDDGIYSRYFTGFTGSGRYSVEVFVENGTPSPVTSGNAGSSVDYYPGYISTDGTVKVNPNGAISKEGSTNTAGVQSNELGNFSRVVPSGSFDYSGTVDVTNPNTIDAYPPGRITDAQLKQIDLEDIKKGIELGFTAPGDDYDSGTASGYEIRYTFGNFSRLINEFYSCMLLVQSDLTTGNLSKPLPAGSRERFTIINLDLPKDDSGNPVSYSYVGVAIVAFDEIPNYSDPSNVPILNIFVEPIQFPEPEDGQQDVWWIILLVIIIVLIIIGGISRLQKWRKTQERKSSRHDWERQQHITTVIGKVSPSLLRIGRGQTLHNYATENEGPPAVPPPRIAEYQNIQPVNGRDYRPIPPPRPRQYPAKAEHSKPGFDSSERPNDEYAEIRRTSYYQQPPTNPGQYDVGYARNTPANQSGSALQADLMNELKTRGYADTSQRWE